ncbi:MAG: type II toxin-antitoxin system RelE/ParE family toxin [Alphaproteobacteria bacterium]|jgi:proteic killer suppression protein|nr:type II toxin-antitoxin system RelE/ParE family toxin [Thalassospira sp.]MCE2964988.1 type II toxin-antitoxin system RelE/ParE family toxin [Alphaproteobacteria bacterium]
MIRSFACKDTAKLFERCFIKKLPTDIQRRAYKKLLEINHIKSVEDLRIPPSNHLEKLSGNRAGQYSIRINGQWRICFRWSQGDAHDVEIVDYH